SVWVNGGLAERKGEYFRKELQVGNGNGPLWTNVTVASGGLTNTGGLVFPDDNQALTYDLDGNLTFDGTWSYTWDAENRLRTMTMTNAIAGIVASNILKLELTYDYQGRRVEKVVKRWDGNGFGNPVTTRFVYDGWNLLAILASDSSLLTSFTWGNDLSGTMGDAGGIGGLLLMQTYSGGSVLTSSFYGYDGNGNVTALVKGGSDPIAARYEYSAFGETLRATGPLAKANPFPFSTKFADDESGFVYYGYRYYSPVLGRFVNRDPIEEEGGHNLYTIALNNLINSCDPLGMNTQPEVGVSSTEAAGMDSYGGASTARTANRIKAFYDKLQDFNDIVDLFAGMHEDVAVDLLQQVVDMRSEVLGKKRGVTSGGALHHIVPQMLRKVLKTTKAKGLDVDEFTNRIAKVVHRRLHSGRGFGSGGMWNGLWNQWMKKNRNPNAGDVKEFAERMRKLFGLDDLNYTHY
ncbi:MAG TPA: RHS repeat-associated core domain-containing protein, partial [Verrucomicrobiae bacterium]